MRSAAGALLVLEPQAISKITFSSISDSLAKHLANRPIICVTTSVTPCSFAAFPVKSYRESSARIMSARRE
jgi:hypothetical protein